MKVAATTANKKNQSRVVANNVSKQKNNSRDDSGVVDNRPETKALKSLQMMINDSPRMAAQRQRTSNITGGKAQVIKGPETSVPNGPAESPKFIRLCAPSPISPNIDQPVQRIRNKTNLSDEEYRAKLRSTVILYAEINGNPVGKDGCFMTSGSNHAEDNLIAKLNELKISTGDLKIWLSTTPCSSNFGTRKDDCSEGCQEKLQKLHNPPTFTVEVAADHLYQPKELADVERDEGFKTAFSSASVTYTSTYPLSVYKQPAWTENSLKSTNEDVAQMKE